MGQQQVILLVLVTIIVGIATVVAINNFQDAQEAANMDAIQQDLMQAHSHSRAYFRKSVTMGGGGGSFADISLADILLPVENDNAAYEITESSAESFTIQYIPGLSQENRTAVITYDEIIWDPEE